MVIAQPPCPGEKIIFPANLPELLPRWLPGAPFPLQNRERRNIYVITSSGVDPETGRKPVLTERAFDGSVHLADTGAEAGPEIIEIAHFLPGVELLFSGPELIDATFQLRQQKSL